MPKALLFTPSLASIALFLRVSLNPLRQMDSIADIFMRRAIAGARALALENGRASEKRTLYITTLKQFDIKTTRRNSPISPEPFIFLCLKHALH